MSNPVPMPPLDNKLLDSVAYKILCLFGILSGVIGLIDAATFYLTLHLNSAFQTISLRLLTYTIRSLNQPPTIGGITGFFDEHSLSLRPLLYTLLIAALSLVIIVLMLAIRKKKHWALIVYALLITVSLGEAARYWLQNHSVINAVTDLLLFLPYVVVVPCLVITWLKDRASFN